MKMMVFATAALTLAMGANAQVGTAMKESGKATVETTKQVGDEVKSTVASEPDKSVDKAKAHLHKAKAKSHGRHAKEAAKEAVH